MQEQVLKQPAFPKRREIFLHIFKTGKLIKVLFTDQRIAVSRKVLFVGAIAFLVAILIFPDIIEEIGFTAILPLIGTVLGIPIDAGFDWMAFALLAVNILHIFPADIVAEHYGEIFK